MPAKRKTAGARATGRVRSEHDDPRAVTAFMQALEHPLKPVMEMIRAAILKADPRITEGIKWNTASFYSQGWFATIGVRLQTGVQVIMHHGTKAQKDSTLSQTIEDSAELLTWLAKDRALITFLSAEDFERKREPFVRIIKQWVEHQAYLARMA